MPLAAAANASAVRLSNRIVAKAVTLGFLAPDVLFALRLRPAPALLVLAGSVGVWLLVNSASARSDVLDSPLKPTRLAACLLLSLAVFVLGGEGHFFYANYDWLARDAVLGDLSRTWSLPAYVEHGERYLLRAPLGLYLVPAVAGKIFGLRFAQLVLLGQDTLILGGIIYLFWAASSGWRTIATMLLWGGWSGLARISDLLLGKPLTKVLAMPIAPLDQWHPLYLQYSSSITQMFWAPNHALPAWWTALLLTLYSQAEIDLAIVAGSVGALVLWSPLAILPAIPSIFTRMRFPAMLREVRNWQGIAVGLAFIPVAIYLLVSAGSIPHAATYAKPNFGTLYFFFELIELPAAVFVGWNIRRLRKPLRGLFWINLAVLLVLPFFTFGPGSDLVTRGSIASLSIVAFCFGEVLFGPQRPGFLGTVIGAAIIAVGAICGIGEIDRAVAVPAYPVSDCTLMQAARTLSSGEAPTNYMAKAGAIPDWLAPSPRSWPDQAPIRSCWSFNLLPP